ncbi:MAG: anthranilate synthase component 1 [Pirellulaceae bacterium]
MPATLQLESVTRPIAWRDPVLLFHHLSRGKTNQLLLESAEIDSKRHLQSFLLVSAALRIECEGQHVTVTALSSNGQRILGHLARQLHTDYDGRANSFTVEYSMPDPDLDEDRRLLADSVFTPLRKLIDVVQVNSTIHEALFVGGLFGYDLVECFEPLPRIARQGSCPNYVMYVAEQLIRLDHNQNSGQLIGSFFYDAVDQSEREDFEEQLAATAGACEHLSLIDLPPAAPVSDEATADKSDEEFCAIVEELKARIYAGEVFQIVPSRSFSMPCSDPLRAYRQLRLLNPSPYMFYMQDEQFALFGASPEMAVKFTAATRAVEVCPIAGTRVRGKHEDGSINADLDGRIELELRTDTKEMAEHLMLVDLARNDLARICEAGTRHIAQLLKVDRYSHVMHLVSRVIGQLREGLDGLHAYQACMNMGTLTGAPKVRAMQLIRQLEGKRRDFYGGGIGYFLGSGDMETCIVIRSALVTGGQAQVQAGAGIVYDSVPQKEADETRTKAAAVINALAGAHLNSGGSA